jgi:amidase
MSQPQTRIHAFADDALGEHDAVELARLVRAGERSPAELIAAAAERAGQVASLNAVVHRAYDRPAARNEVAAPLYGVPTFAKDNIDVKGMPTNHGTAAFTAGPARADDRYTRQFLGTGMYVIGKSRLPEFGFNATTEFEHAPPVPNPWHTGHSIGASSGGAAALVATGVVPIAHANDGGGSIRIPAACAGLIGLKPSRGRHVDAAMSAKLPINMASEGVLTRTVRDTAAFTAAMEARWRNPGLPPVGLVEGPSGRRLRVGLVLESVNASVVCPQTRAAVESTAALLESLGHDVVPIGLPVDSQFADDFLLYWGMLATLASSFGKLAFGLRFDGRRVDGLTKGLRRHYVRNIARTPAALRRLRAVPSGVSRWMSGYDAVLSPVLAHVAPRLGQLSPTVPFDELVERLQNYVSFTPLNNIAGTPAISLPTGLSDEGVPIGVQLSGAHGDERTLLDLAYALEAERPAPRIQDALPTRRR